MNGDLITSLDNSMVKEARSLNDKKHRRFHGKFLVDGEKLVYEAVCGACEIDKIFVDSSRLSDFGYILEKFDGKVEAYELCLPTDEKIMLPCGTSGMFIGK